MSEIQSFVESIFDELVAIRRDIHAHPEGRHDRGAHQCPDPQ